jgi:putative Holliday junction resolvase
VPDTGNRTTHKPEVLVVLGFDWGTQSIGIAIGQSVTATATPLPPLRAKQGIPDWSKLQSIVEEWQPDLFVVGIPLNMDGSQSESSIHAERFGRRLEGRFGISWTGVDERLSSFEVKSRLRQAGETGVTKGSIDSLAAKLILESWFTQNPNATR